MSTDLFLTGRALDAQTSDRQGVDLASERGDIRLVSGRANLAQAVINRLLTRQGELAGLGHPDYGSRLYMLVGEVNNRRTQALAELYIREALASEPRIREVTAVSFAPASLRPDTRSLLEITIAALPLDEAEPLTITIALPL
jgi:phage baseplate assembly protein W